MANGHVEIHDPLTNSRDRSSSKDCDPKSTSDMEDTTEFRLLMAYAQRRRRKDKVLIPKGLVLVGQCGLADNGLPQEPPKAENEVKKGKKRGRRGWKKLPKLLSCISHAKPELSPAPQGRAADFTCRSGDIKEDEVKEKENLDRAVSRLTEIISDVPFTPPEVETDSSDDVEKVIGLLLREAGDRLNEQEEELKTAVSRIFWNYDFFERLLSTLLNRMGLLPSNPDSPGPQSSPKTQIAVTCEVTSRLSAADTLPMRRLLGHGARYLQEHYSTWVQQQGGYEEAFYSDNEDDEE
ncbi:apoptosis facilitator Bcl-2-like protein 14 [Xyrichtys novacula]|uniref:Apoptosis facilitator Bcl-2-like protein 14 n=1 Tax=Xyrichtys novacula TaxID=13765 RepID=A0AAV1F0K0_XYRNO|nr:apoptosis facilitator Bcl-2-like protein 14 [Xyrichtys novacula]